MSFTSWLSERLGLSSRTERPGPRRRPALRRRRYRPGAEVLEERFAPAVSILNGGGLGYVGSGGGGPSPDVTGMAGPSSYIEVNNSTITIFSSRDPKTILATHAIGDFFYTNPAIGNVPLIYSSSSSIAGNPTGATEASTTVTITTTAPHGFIVGQTVTIAGVGVVGYNGAAKITGTPTPTTFTYTASTPGLAPSGGGTVSASSSPTSDSTGVFDNLMGTDGRFIIGEIDIDKVRNVSQYVFAVSTSSNPTTLDGTKPDWNFYHVTTTQTAGGATNWTDYPGNPGFNADAFVETFNLAHGNGTTGDTEVVSINASDLANGVSQASLHTYQSYITGSSDYRPTTMHDSVAGDPMWLIHNPDTGTGIDVVRMDGVLLPSPVFSTTSLPLPAQDNFLVSGGISNPLNPDNTAAIDGDDDSGAFDTENPGGGGAFDVGSRILKAGENNKTIVAAHTVTVAAGPSTLASAQANDKNTNPTGGTGYSVGDKLTVVGGTFPTAAQTPAQLTVLTLGANGAIATVAVANAGSYSSLVLGSHKTAGLR